VAPQYYLPPYLEGLLWVRLGDGNAAARAWREALNRPHDPSERLFRNMLENARRSPQLLRVLEELSWKNPEDHRELLAQSRGEDFVERWKRHLERDPELSYFGEVEARSFLERFSETVSPGEGLDIFKRDSKLSMRFPTAHARALARNGFLAEASQLLAGSLPMPELPALEIRYAAAQLEGQFRKNPMDLVAGLRAFVAAMKEKDTEAARRILHLLRENNKTPANLLHWSAKLATDAGEFDEAWAAWKAFLDAGN
jgi:hypothetical protein